MKFENYRYLYPPRPKNAISPDNLNSWDNKSLIAQPKFNGSNTTIYTDGKRVIVMNRHSQRLTNFKIEDKEILNLHNGKIGKWLVLNGEYMNKGKVDEFRQNYNDKFIIFDLLVYDSNYLIGNTFQERLDILENSIKKQPTQSIHSNPISDNISIVKSYYDEFSNLYNNISKIDMIEGLVLKRRNARLEIGNTENNNTKSQLKCRKPTKNYKY